MLSELDDHDEFEVAQNITMKNLIELNDTENVNNQVFGGPDGLKLEERLTKIKITELQRELNRRADINFNCDVFL